VVTGKVSLHVNSLGLGTCVLCCEDRPWLQNWTSKRIMKFGMPWTSDFLKDKDEIAYCLLFVPTDAHRICASVGTNNEQ